MQHFQGPPVKPLMKIVARFAINSVLGDFVVPINNRSVADIITVAALLAYPMFIKSTFQYKAIYILYANNTKRMLPDYDTYLALIDKSELVSNIPQDMMEIFPTGDPIKSVHG